MFAYYCNVSVDEVAAHGFLSRQPVRLGDTDLQCEPVCVNPSVCSLICGLLSLEPPTFVQRLEDMSCMLGSEISMKCMLSGSLPMTFSWIKDDHELTESEHIKMSFETQSAVLNLKKAQLSHSGKYFCQAQNKAGTQRCAAVLIVTGL